MDKKHENLNRDHNSFHICNILHMVLGLKKAQKMDFEKGKKTWEANSYRENGGIKTLKKSVRSKSASNESASNEDFL